MTDDIDFKTITGRDDQVISRALAWAVATIERLPDNLRPVTEGADMRALLISRVGVDTAESWLAKMRLALLDARSQLKE